MFDKRCAIATYRWLRCYGPFDDDAVHVQGTLAPAGDWSADASVPIPGWLTGSA